MKIGDLSIEGLDKVPVFEGLNLLSVSNPSLYQRMVDFSRGISFPEIVYSVDNQPKLFTKVGLFVGDPIGGVEIRSYYTRHIENVLQDSLSEEATEQLFQLNNQIMTILDGAIIDNNLPFKVDANWQLEKLIKSQHISMEEPMSGTIFGKIVDIVHVMSLMGESKILVLSNLSLYCTLTELEELHKCLLAEGINLLAIDFNQDGIPTDTEFNKVFIDPDFEIWD
ncbi:type II-A CRISPR-associated protein Csn2 [Lactobacillaceae bacterium L1_55_11]|nr:type II-A CRISPR-associated protein Csn2 [Lactobacillaceae bacterium L1_55_11]